MGRVAVPHEQLKQWQVSVKNLALLLAQLLGFEDVNFDVGAVFGCFALSCFGFSVCFVRFRGFVISNPGERPWLREPSFQQC